MECKYPGFENWVVRVIMVGGQCDGLLCALVYISHSPDQRLFEIGMMMKDRCKWSIHRVVRWSIFEVESRI